MQKLPGIPGVPRQNLKSALGGALMVVALLLVIFFIASRDAREWIAMIGVGLVLVAWMVFTLRGIHRSEYVAVNVASTVGFAFWAAFITALGLSSLFREGVLSVGIWVGGIAILFAIVWPAIGLIKPDKSRIKR